MTFREAQTCSNVLLIRPVNFGPNIQTAETNRFQRGSNEAIARSPQVLARSEFDALVSALEQAEVKVHVFEDTPEPHTPDSIFPNNWVSFHGDGTAVLYPMLAPNRRDERRPDLLEALSVRDGFRVSRVVDLTHHEVDSKFLEGTGSLVLDRVNRLAYACVSPRTDLDVLGEFAQVLDYDVVTFEALDTSGTPIYHTNVVLSLGSRLAVVCGASIRQQERAGVLDALSRTGHTVIDVSMEQMQAFACNILELKSTSGNSVLALSQRAFDSFTPEQQDVLRHHIDTIVAVAIPTIEHVGGGSVRCMLAEVALPRKGNVTR
jgi:hypothetical protein